MSSGHAGKGTGVKQSHDSGQIDSAATTPSNPQDLLNNETGHPFDSERPENPAALERPSESSSEPPEKLG